MLSKRERLNKVLEGKLADRPPVTAYRHFPKEERKPEELANIMLDWQNKYDWDFIKIHPSAVFMQEVYGDIFEWETYVEEIFPKKIKKATNNDDLSIFVKKDMNNSVLKDHVEVVKLIKNGLTEDVPIFHTLFTPLTVITNMFECPFVRRHFPADRKENKIFDIIKNRKEELLKALNNITDTYIEYWKAMRKAGADGLFYAGIAWAREDYMTYEEWEEFVKQFDIKFLNEVKKDGGKIIYHTCGMTSNPQRFIDYPIDILHWDQGAGNPSIKELAKPLGKIIPMGGVDEMIFGNNKEKEIAKQTIAAVTENKDIPFILAPYCSVSIYSTEKELRAFRDNADCLLKK
ncbi:uroporphyrinogen decarboxylase family protein [Fusobacterium sp.]|uniref:uroporphyrinogen decarboxylase family protein n=1 Tax=Fusobacterium sp. TaxID=68766 RepID=UPI00396C3A92